MEKEEIKKLNSSVSENQGSRAKREVLINQGESETVEFKASLSDTNRIIEEISALANTNGGKILIGISGKGQVLGVKIGEDTVEKLTNKITQSIEPKIYPKVDIVEIANKEIVVINIIKATNKPYLAFGKKINWDRFSFSC